MARFTQDVKIDALKRAPLFADLSRKELVEVAKLTDELEVSAGTVLVKEGELGHEFFVVVEGEADFTRNGRKLPLAKPVEFFGEISLIEHTQRLATVKATSDMRVFVLGEREFRSLLDSNPRIERKVLKALARRLLTLVETKRHPTLA
jgi:CRP/FNR family transcriptional regulator, cyclic AMP receptor protein